MNDYDASTYGDRVADKYDAWYPGGDPAPIVKRLTALAGDGPVLELGIGTGRIALPPGVFRSGPPDSIVASDWPCQRSTAIAFGWKHPCTIRFDGT